MPILKVGGDVISLELYEFQGTDDAFMANGHSLQYVKCRINTQFDGFTRTFTTKGGVLSKKELKPNKWTYQNEVELSTKTIGQYTRWKELWACADGNESFKSVIIRDFSRIPHILAKNVSGVINPEKTDLEELTEWLNENKTNAFSHETHLKLINILKSLKTDACK